MRYKSIILSIILIIAVLLSSCTSSQEIEDVGIVLATGIDMEGDKYLLTHEVIVPKSSVSDKIGQGPNVQYVQSKGDTIIDALRNASLVFDKKLFLAHNRVIILGEDLAKRGIGDIINFYVSDVEPRESTLLLVVKGSPAHEVMGIKGGLSDTPGKYLFDLLENHRFNLKARDLTLNEFLRYFLAGENVVVSTVQKIEQKEIDKEEEKPNRTILDVTGGAVFRKDRLIGYYTGEEMKGFNFLIDEFENGLIIFKMPDEVVKDNKFVARSGQYLVVEVKASKTKSKVELVEDKLLLKIDVNIEGVLIEDTKGLNISSQAMLEAVRSACAKKVEEYIVRTLEKAQKEFKTDTFSIGNLVHISYPDLWKEISDDWESIFPDLDYKINVKVDVIRAGLINTPVNIEIDEERLKENK